MYIIIKCKMRMIYYYSRRHAAIKCTLVDSAMMNKRLTR